MALPPIIYPSNSVLYSLFPNHQSFSYFQTFKIHLQNELNSTSNKRRGFSRCAVSSSHSNAKILKSNRRSRFGQRLSPYDSDNENEAIHDHDDDDDDVDWLSDVSYTYYMFLNIFALGVLGFPKVCIFSVLQLLIS